MNNPNAKPKDHDEIDLYALLGVDKTSSTAEIKKAYRKLALQVHPDRVDEDQREEAESKFKAIHKAYEILMNENNRARYDAMGMDAFDPTKGGQGSEVDISDLLSQMFFGGMGDKDSTSVRQGASELRDYAVTLEELYKGKTVKFAANKQVLCSICKGSGGKERATPKACERCHGQGFLETLRAIGPGLMQQASQPCDDCFGSGKTYASQDKCKKCKGKRVLSEDKLLEIYIPRGAVHQEKIVLESEGDQAPGRTPGDIIFRIIEEAHDHFERIGPDLSAPLKVTLSEALCGFSRIVLKHLDGRGIQITRERGRILRPGDVLKVPGEGMPLKRSEAKGNLYLVTEIEFPEDGWLDKVNPGYEALLKLLPTTVAAVAADIVDEVEYEDDADIHAMGKNSGDPRFGDGWEDVNEDGDEDDRTQCATQ